MDIPSFLLVTHTLQYQSIEHKKIYQSYSNNKETELI